MLPVLPGKWAMGAGWPLVTPGAGVSDNAAPHLRQSATPAVQGAPVITVTQSDISRGLRNPTTFDIRFRAAPGATINLSTLQCLRTQLFDGCWSSCERVQIHEN
jgi:hypothetical protein